MTLPAKVDGFVQIQLGAQIGNDSRADGIGSTLELTGPCMGGDRLIFLRQTLLRDQIQFPSTEGLDKQFVDSLRQCCLFLNRNGRQYPLGPCPKITSRSSPCHLIRRQIDRDLNSTLPTAFLDVEDTSPLPTILTDGFRAEEKCDAIVRRLGCRRRYHCPYSNIAILRSNRAIDHCRVRRYDAVP